MTSYQENLMAEQIYEHPDNPRKNLGDLTELTESIRKNGIMQNMTVVPGTLDECGREKSNRKRTFENGPGRGRIHKAPP